MPLPLRARKTIVCCFLVLATPASVFAQASFRNNGGEYAIAGAMPGDQVHPHLSLSTAGGYLVWEDNITDGDGLGISARRVDSSLSGSLSPFRVNQNGSGDQERPQVATLNNAGAVFVWQGGKQGFQNIYARFMTPSNTWATGDVLVNTFTNSHRIDPAVASLANGNVAVVWSSFDQDGSMQGVYAQLFSPTGQKIGGETSVNQTTAYNQRTPAVAGLSDGRFVVLWISEQQRFENSVDVYARFFSPNGGAAGSEFLINTGTNICANPSVAASSDGRFTVAWGQKDLEVTTKSWDIFARTVSSAGTGGTVGRVNTWTYGDQYAPRISSAGTDYLVVWTSLGQDGSREGVYGQFLSGSGSLAGNEFRVNTTTVSQQLHPTVASDGASRFLVAWTSFGGGINSFDLFAQRYAAVSRPLTALAAPFVNVLSSNALTVSWPPLAGFNVADYEVYADGAATATAAVTNTWWTMSGLAPSSTHSFQVAYLLTDGRGSPLSAAASNTTYGTMTWGGIPFEWMTSYYGSDVSKWPVSGTDLANGGPTVLQVFLSGGNPLDPSTWLRTKLVSTPQGLFLNWNTQAGLIYQVQTSTDLRTWANVGGPRFAAGAVDSMYVGGSNANYYRVLRLR